MDASPIRPYAGLLCALTALSCESKSELPQQGALSPAPTGAQEEPAKPEVTMPWFVGSWQGKSQLSEELSVEDQDATARGERLRGQTLGGPQLFQMRIELTAEDVTGTAQLGEHKALVSGILLDESLRLNFRGDTLQGMWSGVRGEPGEQAAFSGTVRASTTKTTEERERVQRYSGMLKMEKWEETK